MITVAGRLILHDTWFRAETAQIEALAVTELVPGLERLVVERAAAEWGVPIVDYTELSEFALALGQEIPVRPSGTS